MVATGNHERDFTDSGAKFQGPTADDSGGECGIPHYRRYLMPSAEADTPWCALDMVACLASGPPASAKCILYASGAQSVACRVPWLLQAMRPVRAHELWIMCGV